MTLSRSESESKATDETQTYHPDPANYEVIQFQDLPVVRSASLPENFYTPEDQKNGLPEHLQLRDGLFICLRETEGLFEKSYEFQLLDSRQDPAIVIKIPHEKPRAYAQSTDDKIVFVTLTDTHLKEFVEDKELGLKLEREMQLEFKLNERAYTESIQLTELNGSQKGRYIGMQTGLWRPNNDPGNLFLFDTHTQKQFCMTTQSEIRNFVVLESDLIGLGFLDGYLLFDVQFDPDRGPMLTPHIQQTEIMINRSYRLFPTSHFWYSYWRTHDYGIESALYQVNKQENQFFLQSIPHTEIGGTFRIDDDVIISVSTPRSEDHNSLCKVTWISPLQKLKIEYNLECEGTKIRSLAMPKPGQYGHKWTTKYILSTIISSNHQITVLGAKTCTTYCLKPDYFLNTLDKAFTDIHIESKKQARVLPKSLSVYVMSYVHGCDRSDDFIRLISSKGFFSKTDKPFSSPDRRLTLHLFRLLDDACEYLIDIIRQEYIPHNNYAEPILESITEFKELAQLNDKTYEEKTDHTSRRFKQLPDENISKLLCTVIGLTNFIEIAGKQLAKEDKDSLEKIRDQSYETIFDASRMVDFARKNRQFNMDINLDNFILYTKELKASLTETTKKEIIDLLKLLIDKFVEAAQLSAKNMHEQLAVNIKDAIRSKPIINL